MILSMITINETMSPNVKLVLSILQDEINGDVKAALQKMHPGYTMTWMYKTKKGELFPSTGRDLEKELEEVYPIQNRDYDIKHITEAAGVVMVELIESYPDPETKKVFRTPLVLVLEIQDGKIKTGRHYLDPEVSYLYLSKEEIEKGFK